MIVRTPSRAARCVERAFAFRRQVRGLRGVCRGLPMRRGVFQEYEEGDGTRVFRLRWVEEANLTPEELARSEFIRYLVRRGKLNEGPFPGAGGPSTTS